MELFHCVQLLWYKVDQIFIILSLGHQKTQIGFEIFRQSSWFHKYMFWLMLKILCSFHRKLYNGWCCWQVHFFPLGSKYATIPCFIFLTMRSYQNIHLKLCCLLVQITFGDYSNMSITPNQAFSTGKKGIQFFSCESRWGGGTCSWVVCRYARLFNKRIWS